MVNIKTFYDQHRYAIARYLNVEKRLSEIDTELFEKIKLNDEPNNKLEWLCDAIASNKIVLISGRRLGVFEIFSEQRKVGGRV